MAEKSVYIGNPAEDEEREGFRRGGGSRGRGRGGRSGGRSGGGRRGGGSRGRGRGSRSRGRSKGRGSARAGSVRGARSRAKSKSRSAARSRSRMSQRTATKSQAASRAKAKANKAAASARDKAKVNTNLGTKAQRMNKLGTKYSGKLAGAMRKANAPKTKSVSSLDKKKMRNPGMFSPQDVAAAIGRKSIADTNAGKFKSRNEAYKANQAAVDAQKARFSGYSPSKRSDTSAIAGYGGINAKNLGLGVQAAFNRAQKRNETTGMSLGDSLRFQATRPEFKRDINNIKDLYKKLPTPGNLLMKAVGAFGKKPATETESKKGMFAGIGDLFKNIKFGSSEMPDDTRRGEGRGRDFASAGPALVPPMISAGEQARGIAGIGPSPTVMPRSQQLTDLQKRFGITFDPQTFQQAQNTPTFDYGYGPQVAAARANVDKLTALPASVPLTSFMQEGGSVANDQKMRENYFDLKRDDFMSLDEYLGSKLAMDDLDRSGFMYGGMQAYKSGDVYGGGYAGGGSPMVVMSGANTGLGNVLEHYKTLRKKM